MGCTTKRARGRQTPPLEDKMEREYETKIQSKYKVVKSYAGIEVGTIIKSSKHSNAVMMVNKGYWKAI